MESLRIEPLRTPEEARTCAMMMVKSEPWITLQLDSDDAFKLLNEPAREVYLAWVGNMYAGHVVVNMAGPFAGYIHVLAVAPEWRGKRIGERLIRFAEERIFRDSPNVFLCVSGFNERAQKFYARLGYERIGELKDYVIRGQSEFLMRKTIAPKRNFRPAA